MGYESPCCPEISQIKLETRIFFFFYRMYFQGGTFYDICKEFVPCWAGEAAILLLFKGDTGECVTQKEVKGGGIFPQGLDNTVGEHALDSIGSVGGGFCKRGHMGASAMKSG